jgi:hypothetical protein
VCTDVARAWVCAPCASAEVDRRRAILHKCEVAKVRVETEYMRKARAGQAAAARASSLAARRWKVEQMRIAITDEQAQIERMHARIASLETFRLEQTKRVDAAYSTLRRYNSDMSITSEEFRNLQQQLAAQTPIQAPPTPAKPASQPRVLTRIRPKPAGVPFEPKEVQYLVGDINSLPDQARQTLFRIVPPDLALQPQMTPSNIASWMWQLPMHLQREIQAAVSTILRVPDAMLTKNGIRQMRKYQLQTNLEARGLPTDGLVADLQPRLLNYLASLTQPAPPAAATAVIPPAAALSLNRAKRRLQVNPLFTTNLTRYYSQMAVKLAKCRLRIIDQLLNIYIVKRKSADSCTIVGLELMDHPEPLFYAARMHQQHLSAASEQHAKLNQPLQDSEQPPVWTGPPGTDPEVVAAALGYIVLVLQMLSVYLNVSLPYAMCFGGSQSYVSFNDEDSSRYFLTLLDNANPQHFNRALTLLHFNILYFCDRLASLSGVAGKIEGLSESVTGGTNLAKMQLLPGMLKLIETTFLHLRHIINETTTAAPVTTSQLHTLNAHKHLHATGPTSLSARATPVSPVVLDASLLMSPRVAPSPASGAGGGAPRVGVPIHSAHVRSVRMEQQLESPPFFTDSPTVLSTLGSSPPVTPFDSPPTTPSGMRTLSNPNSKQQDARQLAMRLGPPAAAPPLQLQRSELLTQSKFFGLPPNGYLSAEEPQNSVIMLPSSQQHRLPVHPQSPKVAANSPGPQLQRAHISPVSVMSPSARSPHSSSGIPPTTPQRTAQAATPSASPSCAAAGLAPSQHLRQQSNPQQHPSPSYIASALFQSPSSRPSPSGRALPPPHSHSKSAAPAVYASETDLGWDLVDVVANEKLVGEQDE